jgi:hypothetical protein
MKEQKSSSKNKGAKDTELTREDYFKLLHKATAPLPEMNDKKRRKKDG